MDKFPIGVLAQVTGMSPSTIRAWESRYRVLNPIRTRGKHRLYTATDVATVHRLKTLRREGLSLRRAVQILRTDDQLSASVPTIPGKASRMGEGNLWTGYHDHALEAIRRFSLVELDAYYTTLLALHPPEVVLEQMLMPLLRDLGERWDARPGGVAEEHFLAGYVRNRLGGRFVQDCRAAKGPQLLVACLPGEWHELGLLHFALVMMSRGMRVLYLGPHLPTSEVESVVKNSECAGVVLSGTVVTLDAELRASLTRLAGLLPVPVFVGGVVSESNTGRLERCGVIPVGSDYVQASEFILSLQ